MRDEVDILDLPFLEYARCAAARDAEALGKVGPPWLTFDELVASDMTEIQIEAEYGEETAINVGIARDPEDPEWWGNWENAQQAIQVVPHIVEAYRHAQGQQKTITSGTRISLDPDVEAYFRASGKGWRTRVNRTLRDAVLGPKEPNNGLSRHIRVVAVKVPKSGSSQVGRAYWQLLAAAAKKTGRLVTGLGDSTITVVAVGPTRSLSGRKSRRRLASQRGHTAHR